MAAAFDLSKLPNKTPQYAVSKLFDIGSPGNELYEVFRILKRVAGIISSNTSSH